MIADSSAASAIDPASSRNRLANEANSSRIRSP
jgi:hypothetical protein